MDPTILGLAGTKVRGGTLVVVSGKSSAANLVIGSEPKVIGRDPGCALVLADQKVSGAHFEVMATPWGVNVRDLGSTNGTLLDGHRIGNVVLTARATLRCGDTVLECHPGELARIPLSKSDRFGPLVGGTPPMRALFAQLSKISPTGLSVLIQGETGTGKELVAQAIHETSDRTKHRFTVIDCGSIPSQLAESTLFGHERGSFTGAVEKRTSPFVDAKGGTIFLDELGELPVDMQPKLLRVLERREVQAVGGKTVIPIDVRIIAATRRDLLQEVTRGAFREDLYFRIAQARVVVPPLRQRTEDIPGLVQHLMDAAGRPDAYRRVTSKSLDRLSSHYWSGNVRELKNVVSVAIAYDSGGAIDLAAHLVDVPGRPDGSTPGSNGRKPYTESVQSHDRNYFRELYEAMGGNLTRMGHEACMDRETVRIRLKALGIGRYGSQ